MSATRRKRIRDGIGQANRRRHAVAFAHAFGPEWGQRRWGLDMQDLNIGDLVQGRHRVIGKGPRQKRAIRVIGVFLKQAGANRMGKTAADLAFDHTLVQDRAAVMRGDIAVDAGLGSD